MKLKSKIAIALVTAGCALMFGLETSSAQEHWENKGWRQWHPQTGKAPLSKVGTQCFFCTEDARPVSDSDGDGVLDPQDQCPGTPVGVRVNNQGCAADTDGDGIPDHKDNCPGTPAGATVDSNGCPQDQDGDGVLDHQDRCPGTPRGVTTNEAGCWTVEKLRFESGKSAIRPQFYAVLDEIVTVLGKNPSMKVEIQGHTDNRGAAAYNLSLSQRRARAVMNYLTSQGVDSQRLTSDGYGPNNPIADNDSELGRAKNRRVELNPIR